MRIVSSFHDYYDTVQAAGQDQSLVYLRSRREVELSRETFPFPVFGGRFPPYFGHRTNTPFLSVMQSVIGFCGKIHLLLQLSHPRAREPHRQTALCYTLSDVDQFVEAHFKRHHIEAYRMKRRGRHRFHNASWPWERSRDQFEELFDTYTTKQMSFDQLFIDSGCPIFVASAWWDGEGSRDGIKRRFKLVYNECLKEFEFFRVVDTFTAYQELQWFVGNLARPNKPIPEITDRDMAIAKGFDKWSFRKPPD